MASFVLDASAVLALINGERGAIQVARAAEDALVSTVNLSEVVAKLVDQGRDVLAAEAAARGLPTTPRAHDEGLALRAGALRASTRHLGLSLGDRACLALAEREQLPVLTADRVWAELDIGVEVRLIR